VSECVRECGSERVRECVSERVREWVWRKVAVVVALSRGGEQQTEENLSIATSVGVSERVSE
jgi:hypothetical protein